MLTLMRSDVTMTGSNPAGAVARVVLIHSRALS
jgi:hypothetical protein